MLQIRSKEKHAQFRPMQHHLLQQSTCCCFMPGYWQLHDIISIELSCANFSDFICPLINDKVLNSGAYACSYTDFPTLCRVVHVDCSLFYVDRNKNQFI